MLVNLQWLQCCKEEGILGYVCVGGVMVGCSSDAEIADSPGLWVTEACRALMVNEAHGLSPN